MLRNLIIQITLSNFILFNTTNSFLKFRNKNVHFIFDLRILVSVSQLLNSPGINSHKIGNLLSHKIMYFESKIYNLLQELLNEEEKYYARDPDGERISVFTNKDNFKSAIKDAGYEPVPREEAEKELGQQKGEKPTKQKDAEARCTAHVRLPSTPSAAKAGPQTLSEKSMNNI